MPEPLLWNEQPGANATEADTGMEVLEIREAPTAYTIKRTLLGAPGLTTTRTLRTEQRASLRTEQCLVRTGQEASWRMELP